MPTSIDIASEWNRHHESDTQRVKELVDQEYDVDIPRRMFLRFSAAAHEDAVGLNRLLFAKGLRLITPEPREESGRWITDVAVIHTLREITAEDFVVDLVTLATGVHARYDSWNFLSEEHANQTGQQDSAAETP